MRSTMKIITIVLITYAVVSGSILMLLQMGSGACRGNVLLSIIAIGAIAVVGIPAGMFYFRFFLKYLFRVTPEAEDEIDTIIKNVQKVDNNIYNNPYKS